MTARAKLKEAFDVEAKHFAFFTGRSVYWTNDGKQLLCQKEDSVVGLNFIKGSVDLIIGGTENAHSFGDDADKDIINSFALSHDNESVVTSHKSGLFKLWSKSEARLLKMWRSVHKGPISKMVFNRNGQLATGGTDGAVRQWDLVYQACTHNFKGSQGVISALIYHPNKNQILGAADDTKIRCWDTESGELLQTLAGHYSNITSICVHEDGDHAVSAGRDKVLILWDLIGGVSQRTLPVYECIESVLFLPSKFIVPNYQSDSDRIHVISAGDLGLIKVWDMTTGKEVYSQSNSLVNRPDAEGGLAITHLFFNNLFNQVGVVSADHNIIFHDLETFKCIRQFVGFSDEILDIVLLGENDSLLAVATNSKDIKLYDNETMNCQLLKGHTDIILALAGCPVNSNFLMSSSKDNTVMTWLYDPSTSEMSCIAVGARHTDSVGSVAVSQLSATFAASVSQDTCLKLWQISDSLDNKILNCTHTELAHSKDINCVTISPNDKLIATGSQDKTAKLWAADNLQQLGVFRGHRRGIWNVRFSPLDQVLLSSSADCSVKLWSLTEFNCLKTIEGHDASVLRAEFLARGMQILTAGGDGLLKLWNVKNSECVTTLEEHAGRIWALAVSKDESMVVTGGADSLLVKWKDVTVEKRDEAIRTKEHEVLQEQELQNLVQSKQLLKALRLALRLARPLQVLKIIQEVAKTDDINSELKHTIHELSEEHKEILLRSAITWNTNSKHCYFAQVVINILMNELLAGDFRPTGLGSIIEELLPYTERHFNRLTQYLKDLHYISYVINCMQPYSNK